jgi:hypothetical protein
VSEWRKREEREKENGKKCPAYLAERSTNGSINTNGRVDVIVNALSWRRRRATTS